tara:strand:- start:191 stop:397 length:207 start_codon:yes stop_codon:yes gene_type:complete
MVHSNKKDNNGMTFQELLAELKRLRIQMKYFRAIQKESELLDAEYYQIVKMQQRGQLNLFDVPNAEKT